METKTCTKCKENKELSGFYFRKDSNSYRKECILCLRAKNKIYMKENKESIKQRMKKWAEDNKEYIFKKSKENSKKRYKTKKSEILKKNKKWAEENKERMKFLNNRHYKENKKRKLELARIWNKNNPDHIRNKQAKRRAAKLNAIIDGYNKEIKEIYKKCPSELHVDHIVPLQGKTVCGLHVPWNLQYLTAEENLKKSNKFDGTLNNEEWRVDV